MFQQIYSDLLKHEIEDKGNDVSVSSVFPFTAEQDGIMTLVFNPASSNSISYLYIEDNLGHVGAAYSTNGCIQSLSFVIQKGKTYKVNSSSNVSTIRRPQILYLYK